MDLSFWDVLWTTFVVFVWAMFLVILFNVVLDLFRSHDVSGLGKAGWLILIVVLPFLGILIYLIVRGSGMSARAHTAQQAQVKHLRDMVGGGNPTEQIAQAKALLDQGAINQAEFDRLKVKALG